MANVICLNCSLATATPIFYCPRCGRCLCEAQATGIQAVLKFDGGLKRTLTVQSQGTTLRLRQMRFNGARIGLVLDDNRSLERNTSELFEVLQRGEQLWKIE